mmetsp:Transcript_11680/g.43525  ORF Transcript_11680/g.43525 Transcript_11680/m.43525 type:complete len:227 (-) Transcript_11680:289-969(-)
MQALNELDLIPSGAKGIALLRSFQKNNTYTPHIAIVRISSSIQPLRRHILEGAGHRLCQATFVLQPPRDAKVAQLGFAPAVHQHVRRLHVPVQLAVVLEEGQPPEHLVGQRGQDVLWDVRVRRDLVVYVVQRAAIHILQDAADLPALQIGPVEPDERGAVHIPEALDLREELPSLRPVEDVEDLQRVVSAVYPGPGQLHLAARAAPDVLVQDSELVPVHHIVHLLP